MKIWKLIGLAGVVGLTVAGATVAVNRRRERQWQDFSADDVRERLHARFAARSDG